MKKLHLLLCAVLCAAFMPVSATGYYLSVSDGDTLRISPNGLYSNLLINMAVVAEFDNGVADHFRLEVTHSTNLKFEDTFTGNNITAPNYGINIPYYTSDGMESLYNPTITTLLDEDVIDTYIRQTVYECSTTAYGYWDYNHDGSYEPYGLVKWGPGHYDRLFDIRLEVKGDCTGDSIVIDGLITSTYDTRYPTYTINNYPFHRVVHLVMAYLPGDVNGDESVDIDDVTALISYLDGSSTNLNQYQLDAADVDPNGVINIDDVTTLIDMLQQ